MAANDEAAIRALIRSREAAVHGGDANAFFAPLAADVVVYDLQPPLRFEGAAARDADALREWLATWDGPVSVETPEPAIAVDGDLAFAHGLSRMRGAKKGQERGEMWFRSTLCLRRMGGAWRVVHEHNSLPMLMDGSDKVALDLRP